MRRLFGGGSLPKLIIWEVIADEHGIDPTGTVLLCLFMLLWLVALWQGRPPGRGLAGAPGPRLCLRARHVALRRVCCIRRTRKKRLPERCQRLIACVFFSMLRGLELICTCVSMFLLLTCVVVHGVDLWI